MSVDPGNVVIVVLLGVAAWCAVREALRARADRREVEAAERRVRLREARERASKLGSAWLAHQRGRGLV